MGKKIKIAIMIITLGIFIVPTSVFAHIDYSHRLEKNCCSDSTEHSPCDCCKNHKKQEEGNKDCNGTCVTLACPSTTALPVNYRTSAEETNDVVVEFVKNRCYYTKQQPKPVYFQIWSPPKLS